MPDLYDRICDQLDEGYRVFSLCLWAEDINYGEYGDGGWRAAADDAAIQYGLEVVNCDVHVHGCQCDVCIEFQ
jgi:hypothetical protein